MKRILGSAVLILGTVTVVSFGATGAFFSDTEESTSNTFAAGAIDLKVDNESYYNGMLNEGTSWSARDLTIEKFFDFDDVKPNDYGEDTISLHVETNDAYLCADVTLTSNDDNTQTEPEGLVDATPEIGELASLVNFLWWADDGDNILEDDENVISRGPIGAIGLNGIVTVPLADSNVNIWTGEGGPVPGNETLYIGKAWCFGDIEASPLEQDGGDNGRSPAGDNNSNQVEGEPIDGGFMCDGSQLGNESQTDSLTADVIFRAVQARHNENFACLPPGPTAHIIVKKIIINNDGGNNVINDFSFFVEDGIVTTQVDEGEATEVPVGSYTVTETGVQGYVASFSGDCDSEGNITVAEGETKTCTITNNDLPANITLFKNVINNTNDGDPNFGPTSFGLRIDGVLVQHNSSVAVLSNTPHTINETGRSGYAFVGPITGTSSYGKSCPAVLGGSITLDEGETIVCTITNDDN